LRQRLRRGGVLLLRFGKPLQHPALQTGTIISTGQSLHLAHDRAPTDRPAKFNGVVIVEWVNVTPGYNFDLLWIATADYLIREGMRMSASRPSEPAFTRPGWA
jgi:hypothetical protein